MNRTDPMHLQGVIKGFLSVYSSSKQILHYFSLSCCRHWERVFKKLLGADSPPITWGLDRSGAAEPMLSSSGTIVSILIDLKKSKTASKLTDLSDYYKLMNVLTIEAQCCSMCFMEDLHLRITTTLIKIQTVRFHLVRHLVLLHHS